jgi:hypothetical protein
VRAARGDRSPADVAAALDVPLDRLLADLDRPDTALTA